MLSPLRKRDGKPGPARRSRDRLGAVAQLEFSFQSIDWNAQTERAKRNLSGPDPELEATARQLLNSLGETRLARVVQVEWSRRMRSAAGQVDLARARIRLNPHLYDHGAIEIDRTLRHELAHLVAQARAGRRRISPHGAEWRRACDDLGIAGELRCHNLPFEISHPRRRYLYQCPNCRTDFPRVRRIRRPVACLACCRRHNRGRFDRQFQLRLVQNRMLA